MFKVQPAGRLSWQSAFNSSVVLFSRFSQILPDSTSY